MKRKKVAFWVFTTVSSIALTLFATAPKVNADNAISFDYLDAVNTSLSAYKAVNDYVDSKIPTTVKPVFYISPNMGNRNTKLVLAGWNRVATLWSDFVRPDKLNVVLYTEQDLEWADQKQIEFTGEWLQTDALPSNRFKQYGCNTGGMYLPGLLLFCVKNYEIASNTSEYYAEVHKFAHEYTHFMEMKYKDWMAHARGKGIGTRNPCWIEEGFATFYGFAIGSNPTDPSGKLRREFTRNLTYSYDRNQNQTNGTLAKQLILGNVAETKRLFRMLENTPWPCDETHNAYALGSMAAEALVAVKGQEGMNNFYKASARTGDWKASFQLAFGLSVDSFYEKLTPYLASQFTESNFKYEVATPAPSPTESSPSPSASADTQSPAPVETPKPVASVSATIKPKIITITCIKNKSVKKISGISPKCPTGYKKK